MRKGALISGGVALLTAIVLVVVFAVGGSKTHTANDGVPSHTPPSDTTASTRAAQDTAGQLGQCVLYDQGTDLSLTVTAPDPATECQALAVNLAGGGSFWTTQAQQNIDAIPLTPSMVCILTSGNVTVQVQDTDQTRGQSACSDFQQSGWVEDTAAEQGIDVQSAASVASASVAQAQSNDQSIAQNAVTQVQQDTGFSKDLASLAGDVKTAASDLTTTRQDADAGQGDACSNTGAVASDAGAVYSDQGAALSDVNAIKGDIQNLQHDVTALDTANQQLTTDGLGAAAGSQGAVTAATSAIQNAEDTANTDIDKVNADVVSAYSIAHGLASGACTGDGPGPTPTPLSHI